MIRKTNKMAQGIDGDNKTVEIGYKPQELMEQT